jgi:hypothetical protein
MARPVEPKPPRLTILGWLGAERTTVAGARATPAAPGDWTTVPEAVR